MKHLFTCITLFLIYYASIAQNVLNPYTQYFISQDDITLTESWAIPTYTWWHRTDLATPFTGEYVIQLARHPWRFWDGPPNSIHISYSVEVVSFPFTTTCAFSPTGCAGTIGRPFYMPSDPYDVLLNKWGGITNYYKSQDLNQGTQALVSNSFTKSNPMSSTGPILPHTVIKHTIYLHCGVKTTSPPFPPVLYSQSWVYDNTRGMMKQYPPCILNCGGVSPPPGCCAGQTSWDIAYYPELISFHGQAYSHTEDTLYKKAGTLDYFPYSELTSLPSCNVASLNIPSLNDHFNTSAGTYLFPYPTPYSLLNATPLQNEGEVLACFTTNYDPANPGIDPLPGIEHSYNIDQSIPLTDISVFDRTFYNPSDVNVTATNLRFPSHYTFKTIRAVYPSPLEVNADNTPENGGPYPDPRDVPVRTDLRSEDPAFAHDEAIPEDSRYASLYRLKNGSKITIEPCVNIFDAAFILEPGSTLVYENYLTQKGYYPDNLAISRVAIDRNGGRLVRQYDNSLPNATLYLQHQTEVATAPNSYIVDEKILAGSNVDPGQQAGPYIASSGSALELIAKNYVKLADGFQAHAGAEVKIAVDPAMSIPACPPVPPTQSNNNRMLNPQIEQADPSLAKAILSPNPVQQQTMVSLLQSGNENYIQQLQLHDVRGQLLFSKENLTTNNEIIDVSAFTEGIYLLTVTTNHQTEVLKLVVNKGN